MIRTKPGSLHNNLAHSYSFDIGSDAVNYKS